MQKQNADVLPPTGSQENRLMLSQLDNLNQNTLDDCTMALGATAAIVGDGKAVDSTGKG